MGTKMRTIALANWDVAANQDPHVSPGYVYTIGDDK
jgi:hypothetical protein